ncbi:hypothetical protein IW492_05795 [Enterococcus sp. BWB1-3]|uniref:hypothetical protein n=1 Tax=Enterococcus sp. BWB1-3 TaxID=2787713 RepID=UPI001924D893|nr:hypothetical protein [Enterococcus sp. BWB1-3]MBL1228744.1 hypothetical protein [Enterococcus sp. BWB1-3]
MRFFKTRKKRVRQVTHYSNVIQYDEMGYPLRLVIMSDGNQVWLDSYERTGDVVLKWERVEEIKS